VGHIESGVRVSASFQKGSVYTSVYVHRATLNTQRVQQFQPTAGRHDGMYAALQSYGLGSIPRAVILFFRYSIYFVFTVKFTF